MLAPLASRPRAHPSRAARARRPRAAHAGGADHQPPRPARARRQRVRRTAGGDGRAVGRRSAAAPRAAGAARAVRLRRRAQRLPGQQDRRHRPHHAGADRARLAAGDRRRRATRRSRRAQLLAMEQHEHDLPIACVEGWSTTQRWSGVRLRDLAALAGAPAGAVLRVESLQPRGVLRRATLGHAQHATSARCSRCASTAPTSRSTTATRRGSSCPRCRACTARSGSRA